MSNSIIELLNLVDDDLNVINQEAVENTIYITIEKLSKPHICPICGCMMHSKGIYKRTVNHPTFIDGRNVILYVNKRKYKCSNPNCGYMNSDNFKFVQVGKHNSNALPLLILKEFKSLSTTATDVAAKLNVSPTLIQDTFLNSFSFERLPLSEVISVDEVYMNFDYRHKYPLVILDFISGYPIDILNSRREEDTHDYFLNIPLIERENVKYLICDMYNPYINYVSRYFPKAKCIVDNFHVIKWLNNRLNTYINSVKKKYEERDKKNYKENDYKRNMSFTKHKDSREVYILKHYKYFLLSNKENIEYSMELRYDRFLNMYLDTYQKEKLFMNLDSKFTKYREMKELYSQFANRTYLNQNDIEISLDTIIDYYINSEEGVFIGFGKLLKRYKEYIINSFTYITIHNLKEDKPVQRRLSNGLIESFNNNPKNLKRASKGLKNFEYARARILWATRKNPTITIKTNKN